MSKRFENVRRNDDNRFSATPQLSNETPFGDGKWNGSKFVFEWQMKCPDLETLSYGDILRQAIDGLHREGIQDDRRQEAEWIVQHLTPLTKESFDQIGRACVRLYTMDMFVCPLLNKTLRDDDFSKLDTLGAFAYLLFQFNFAEEFQSFRFVGRVYRGANLSQNQINEYRKSINQTRSWLGFTSTSRKREIAESFSQTNVLFIIDIRPTALCSALTVSQISIYPHEDEVLIRAGQYFTIQRVEPTDSHETLIYLTIE